MKTYNLDQIVSIEIKNKREVKDLVYTYQKKTFFCKEKEGFMWFSELYSIEGLRKGDYFEGIKLIVEDKKVFYRPCIIVTFSNNDSFCKVFDDYQSVKDYKISLKKQVPHLHFFENED